jgi:hypothetical protein
MREKRVDFRTVSPDFGDRLPCKGDPQNHEIPTKSRETPTTLARFGRRASRAFRLARISVGIVARVVASVIIVLILKLHIV